MNYKTETFSNYLHPNGNMEYLKVNRSNQESYEDIFADILPVDKKAKVLEIGCGAGQLLNYIRGRGFINIEGVDLGEDQINIVLGLGIKGTVIGSIPQFLMDKECLYDCIIMNQVIEHFSKDELWKNLHSIRSALKPGGKFIFVTPNMACLSGLFQRYIDITHEIGFTERSAYQVMRILGFKNIVVGGSDIKFKMRPKRAVWWIMNFLWIKILGFIFFIERGMDRPRILTRHLVVSGII